LSCKTVVLGALLLLNPLSAAEPAPDFLELQQRGEAQVRTGSRVIGTGLAFLPLCAIALIPVIHDGAFGITAADPGFAIFFGMAGGGLIHAGIPLVGFGSEKLERSANRLAEGSSGETEAGWTHYRRSWKLLTIGSGALLAAFPFALVAALDIQGDNEPVAYVAMGLGSAGLGLMAISVLEQHYSLFRFAMATRNARKQLRANPPLSLVPDLRWDGQGKPRAGMRLVGTF
jgi:hypothetical protein